MCACDGMDFIAVIAIQHRSARRRFPPLRDLTVASFSHNLPPHIIIGHLFAQSGSMSGLFPPPRFPDEERTATPGISSATSPALLVSSVGKCYCNTCSSRHIPLALTLQPLAKLGPAIQRDKDSTVPGPPCCASLFSDGVIFLA